MWAKTVGDFNNDGRTDFAAGGAGSFVWYEATSDPSNWIRHPISVSGRGWEGAEAADVDGDGFTDIVTGPDSGLYWLRNLDGGTTWQQLPIDPSHINDALYIADYDNDGDQDIAARTSGVWNGSAGRTLKLYRQDGFNTWTKYEFSLPSGGEYGGKGDVDNDGDIDLVVGDEWFENDGTVSDTWTRRTFTSSWNYGRTFAEVADMNGDGRNDIILTPSEISGVTHKTAWYQSPPDPTGSNWTEHIIEENIEAVTHSLQIADIDKDGTPDVVTAEMHQSSDPDEIRVYRNTNGDGQTFEKVVIATSGSHWLKTLDHKNDGDIDLVGANWMGTQVDFWENTINDPSLDRWTYIEVDDSRGARYFGLAARDVTGDGFQDIASGRYFYINPGSDMTGVWTRVAFSSNRDALLALDVDEDSLGDLIAMDSSGNVYWMEAASIRASSWTEVRIGSMGSADHGISSQGYALGQIVAGGSPEILINVDDNLVYFEIPSSNPEAGNWPATQIASLTNPEGIAVGDMDNDGDDDVVGSTNDTTVVWWENPSWTMHAIGVVPGAYADRFCVADFDGDGRRDVAVATANGGADGLYWFDAPADPTESNWPRTTIASQDTTNSMHVADVDNDGDTDIITGEHRGSETISIWENDGSAAFTEQVVNNGVESHLGVLPSDLDGDGDLDLVSIRWDDYPVLFIERNDSGAGANDSKDH